MKANEAPEKLYMNWINYPLEEMQVEYTRTDAFIEKVADYFNSKLYDWVSITNPDQRSCANVIPKKGFIEDFINYMKGE